MCNNLWGDNSLSKLSLGDIMKIINIIRKHLLLLTVSFLLCHIFFSTAYSQQKTPTFQVGKMVQGEIYGIKVIEAEKKSEYEDYDGRITPSQPNHNLLVLIVKFYKNGNPLKESTVDEIFKLSIVDANGHRYSVPLTESNELEFRYVVYGKDPEDAIKKEGFSYKVFFSVPKNSSGFKLQYQDLPKIVLGL
jgi:hypothetical protein